jgi:glycosyltransferase involved in cell wall biosynthesis
MDILRSMQYNLNQEMSTSTNLSVIILAHRVDQRLEDAIKSVQFANEVLVVNNTRTESLSDLQEQYRFTLLPWSEPISDWSTVRNSAINHAAQDWVLFLDSDEVISVESVPQVQSLIENNFFDGALIKRSDVFHGRKLNYGEAGNQPLVRIGKKNKMSFSRPVHEEAHIKGLLSTTDIEILHHSHLSITDFFQTVCRYARMEARYRFDNGQKLFLPTMALFPLGKFLLNYFGKLGFLDGWQGLVYAFMMSLHSICVRVYQYELEHGYDQ